MQLPFTVEQFFDVIRAYNMAVWPAQAVVLALALVAVVLVVMPQRWSGAGVSLILATFWAWLGLVYHLAFFTTINPLAYAFAAISVAAAAVFFWHGVVLRQLEFRWVVSARGGRWARFRCIRAYRVSGLVFFLGARLSCATHIRAAMSNYSFHDWHSCVRISPVSAQCPYWPCLMVLRWSSSGIPFWGTC